MPKIKTFAFFKRSFPYIKKYKALLIIDLLFSVAATLCEIMFPKLLRYTADLVVYALKNKLEIPFNLIFKNASIFLILATLEVVGIYYMNYFGHLTGAKIETDMRRDMFAHIQKLNIDYFTKTKVGQLLSRFTHDLSKITEFMHHLPEQIVISSLKFILCTIFILKINLQIGVVILIFSPIMFLTCRHYNIKLRKAFKENAVQLGELNSQVENSLLGVYVTKSFANEKFEEEKFEVENKKTYKTKQNLYINLGKFNGIMRFFVLLAYFLITAVGLHQLILQNIQVTSYLTCFMYADMFLKQIILLLHSLEKYQEGHTPLIRFFEILDTKPNIIEKKHIQHIEKIYGKIEFKNAYFKYSKEDPYLIKNLNVVINPGEKVALIGLSGAGKTTLCSLLQRFYDLTSGEILIDGINIKNISLAQLHKNVGVVEQNIYLFPGTIFQNINYGNLNATKKEVFKAAEKAGLMEFISSLPKKMETNVGERGIMLSGGQKQRISIARMFLKNPTILVLDEATSSLDIKTEKIIKDSLKELSHNKTTITIAHKPSTIRNSDNILILENGQINEKGPHNELIKNSNFYKNIYYENY